MSHLPVDARVCGALSYTRVYVKRAWHHLARHPVDTNRVAALLESANDHLTRAKTDLAASGDTSGWARWAYGEVDLAAKDILAVREQLERVPTPQG